MTLPSGFLLNTVSDRNGFRMTLDRGLESSDAEWLKLVEAAKRFARKNSIDLSETKMDEDAVRTVDSGASASKPLRKAWRQEKRSALGCQRVDLYWPFLDRCIVRLGKIHQMAYAARVELR